MGPSCGFSPWPHHNIVESIEVVVSDGFVAPMFYRRHGIGGERLCLVGYEPGVELVRQFSPPSDRVVVIAVIASSEQTELVLFQGKPVLQPAKFKYSPAFMKENQ
ncbi:hypothetical protein TanjilG_09295 [Lupinus angustifolius]|uniref:Uncharacterized protein n=1 Tax=Lupinus angustifolius TaxID=3871 RepID=A0A4P1RMP0_LUPAN|nr:hypothetical protein TanjilG_09295 [Lupinus angustifolius]